jgi:predicted transcriptional regulator
MSDSTVSENAKFNVSTKHKKEDKDHISVDGYVNKSVVPFPPEMCIYEAAKKLMKKGWTGAPVLNEKKEMVGFLSAKDILQHAYDAKYNSLPPGTVEDYMTKDLTVVAKGTEIYDVIDLFIKNSFQSYPVVNEDGNYAGVVNRSDVLKAVCDIKDKVW